MRVLHAHRAALDAQYLVRGISQLEYIPLQALDREVLVDRADQNGLRFQHDAVIRIIGNRAARSDGGQARALARAQHLVHGVVMQQRSAASAPGAESFREHPHACVEILPRQIAVGMGSAHQREQFILRPLTRGHLGGDLLGQHIQSILGDLEPVQFAAADRLEQRRALHQFVA